MTTATLRLGLALASLTALSACGGDDDGTTACEDGQSRACDCTGGGSGTQVCAGGVFGACMGCVEVDGGGVDGAAVDAAGPDAFVPTDERCDGRDNDLDGAADEWESPGNEECMTTIAAGTFTMGCDPADAAGCPADAQPAHEVTLDSFQIDRTEVTQAAYQACMDAGTCMAPTGPAEDFDPVAMANRPVVWVNWQRALAFCTWTGRRLPTEAEWERAARGTDDRSYPWGAADPSCDLAVYTECPDDATHVVGGSTGGDSVDGAHDLSGNVAEWVIDFYDAAYYGSATDWNNPIGPGAGTQRVQRGGGWDGDATTLAAWARSHMAPGAAGASLGFRCAAPAAE